MQKMLDKTEEVYQIVSDFSHTLWSSGVNQDWIIQISIAMLCRAKGDDVISGVDNALSCCPLRGGYDVKKLVSQIRNAAGNEIDSVLPIVAELFINRTYRVPRGVFDQPKELTNLVLQLAKERGCKTVYNPFAGWASYGINDFADIYYAQEINNTIHNVSKMLLYLNGKNYSNCTLGDSINEWNDFGAQCILSTPPFGAKVSPEISQYLNVTTVEEYLLKKYILSEAKYGFFVVSRGICFNNRWTTKQLREIICEHHMLEMVINLPSGLFTSTGIFTSIIVLNKNMNDNNYVTFVDAERLFSTNNRKSEKTTTVDWVSMFPAVLADKSSTYNASYDEIKDSDYSFDATNYVTPTPIAKKGQTVVSLGDIIEIDEGEKVELEGYIVNNILNDNYFIKDILAQKDVSNEGLAGNVLYEFKGPHLVIDSRGRIYLHKGVSEFLIEPHHSNHVFKLKSNKVDLEYLTWKLLQNDSPLQRLFSGTFTKKISPKLILNCKLGIDNLPEQHRIIRQLKEAEVERLGIREAGSDLSHMLGMPKDKIENLIRLLLSSKDLSEKDRMRVRAIEDNHKYMMRLVNTVGADFSSITISKHAFGIARLIREYAKTLGNIKISNCFSIEEDVSISDEAQVTGDEDLIRVILDAAFRNAYSHGFEKKYSDSNKVLLGCRTVEYENRPYACITIANNGRPLESNFTVEDFSTRGLKAGIMGNTGRGGYHIYSIAKTHNGYISISSSVLWPFILEILLPVININNSDNIEHYGNKCI